MPKSVQSEKRQTRHRIRTAFRKFFAASVRFLDNRQVASVLGISYQDEWVTMLYKSRDGRVEHEKQDLEYFYDFWVKMYLRRSNRAAPDQAREPTLYVEWEESGKSHTLSRTLH